MKFWTCCAVGALFPIGFAAAPASGQTTPMPVQPNNATARPDANAANDHLEVIQDIVVTAQKRSESLQRTPLSITALTGDTLGKRGVASLLDLQSAVPNVNIAQRISYGVVTIRGVGYDVLTPGADSSVAVHQDGVYISRPAAALTSLFDIERIEVARGPQGTLYGRNATGGAVNIISRAPTENLSGYLTAGYGNFNAYSVEGAIGGTLVPGLLTARIAGKVEGRDGYGKNLFNGRDVDDLRSRAVRASFRLTPADNFTADLILDYFREKDSNFAFHFLGTYDPSEPVLPGVSYGGITAPNIRDVANDAQPLNNREFYGANLTLKWNLADGLSLRSISGARRSNSQFTSDLDATTFNYTSFFQEERDYQLSQELQGVYHNDRIDAILGGYYFYEHNFGATIVPFNAAIPTLPHTGAPAVPWPPLDEQGLLITRAEAVFGQITYKFTDQLSATIGGRYSHESKDVDETATFFGTTPQKKTIAFSAFTPKFGLQFQANRNLLAYVSVSKGFKSGGFALGQAIPPFQPENIWSYEAGLKLTMLNGKLRANGAVFHYDYDNLQTGVVNSVGTAIVNANAKVDGAEIELEARPVPALTLTANASYLHARYSRFRGIDDPGIAGVNPLDLDGNSLSQSPKFTFNVAAEYNVATNLGTFTPRVDYSHTSKYYFTPFNVESMSQSAYGLLNASLRFATRDDKWSVELYARNLTDKLVVAGGFVGFFGVGSPEVVSLAPPRTYGARVSVKF